MPPKKKIKSAPAAIPSSIMVNFMNQAGEQAGDSQMNIPSSSNAKQMESLVNSLLENKDTTPYAFYIHDVEVTSSVMETLQQLQEEANGERESLSFEGDSTD